MAATGTYFLVRKNPTEKREWSPQEYGRNGHFSGDVADVTFKFDTSVVANCPLILIESLYENLIPCRSYCTWTDWRSRLRPPQRVEIQNLLA